MKRTTYRIIVACALGLCTIVNYSVSGDVGSGGSRSFGGSSFGSGSYGSGGGSFHK